MKIEDIWKESSSVSDLGDCLVCGFDDASRQEAEAFVRKYVDDKLKVMSARLIEAMKAAGLSAPDNVCAHCGHGGWDHDLGNWCLTCPRPQVAPGEKLFSARIEAGWCFFSSMSGEERWAYAAKKLLENL